MRNLIQIDTTSFEGEEELCIALCSFIQRWKKKKIEKLEQELSIKKQEVSNAQNIIEVYQEGWDYTIDDYDIAREIVKNATAPVEVKKSYYDDMCKKYTKLCAGYRWQAVEDVTE